MKKILFFLLLSFLHATLLASCQNGISITSRIIKAPVFPEISKNIIMEITVDVPESEAGAGIKEIMFETGPKSLPDFLKSITLSSVDDKEIAAVNCSKGNKKYSIITDIPLTAGKNHFKIGAAINAVSTGSELEIKCAWVKVGKKKFKVEKSSSFFRAGRIVRKPGDNGIECYRIPGIIKSVKGTLIAVYDIRKKGCRDLPGDIDIGMSRSLDGGNTWEPMRTIIDMEKPDEENGVGDPSVLVDENTGTIWVAGLWSHGSRAWNGSGPGISPDETGQIVLVKSHDDGLTWSAPINITPQVKNPKWNLFFQGPGIGITMKNGTLVFPAQFRDANGIPWSTIIYSRDNGKTWKTGSGVKENTTEAQVVEMQNGLLMINMRDNRGGARSVAVSSDIGNSWIEHETSRKSLIEPVCMASLIRVSNLQPGIKNPVLAFCNPDSRVKRDSITVKFSLDDGSSWMKHNSVLIDERECFGYSSIVKLDNEHLGILYEGRGELFFVKVAIPPSVLKPDIEDSGRAQGSIIRK